MHYWMSSQHSTWLLKMVGQPLFTQEVVGVSGGTIRRELDSLTRFCVLASTSIPIGNVGDEKKDETTEDVLSGR